MPISYVEFKSDKDLEMLKVIVEIKNLEYRPSDKKSVGSLSVTLTTPRTSYLYGNLRVEGTPMVSKLINFSLDTASQINQIKQKVTETVKEELWVIKSEIREILKNGIIVKISLEDTLDRILSKAKI